MKNVINISIFALFGVGCAAVQTATSTVQQVSQTVNQVSGAVSPTPTSTVSPYSAQFYSTPNIASSATTQSNAYCQSLQMQMQMYQSAANSPAMMQVIEQVTKTYNDNCVKK